MRIDPRIANRLKATFERRIDDFDAEADSLLESMIIECRRLDKDSFVSFSSLADRLDEYRMLLAKHPPQTDEGKLIRAYLLRDSNDLSSMFSRLANIAAEKG